MVCWSNCFFYYKFKNIYKVLQWSSPFFPHKVVYFSSLNSSVIEVEIIGLVRVFYFSLQAHGRLVSISLPPFEVKHSHMTRLSRRNVSGHHGCHFQAKDLSVGEWFARFPSFRHLWVLWPMTAFFHQVQVSTENTAPRPISTEHAA